MSDSVQVWQIPLRVDESRSRHLLSAYRQCLSSDEKDKADRFRFSDDRRRFIMARGTLRHLLARELNQSPAQVTFCYGTYGKPSVSTLEKPLSQTRSGRDGSFHFNLSHSGEIALCALGHRRAVGIDIEQVRILQRLDGMIQRTLVASEQQQVRAQTDPARTFLQHWTCKEAYLKAIGLGLTQPMQTVEVQVDPPRLLQVPEHCAEGWHLHLIDLPQGYVGALAVEGQTQVDRHQWQH